MRQPETSSGHGSSKSSAHGTRSHPARSSTRTSVCITQKLEDSGSRSRGATVGDERENLCLPSTRGSRADAVIVNGGLGDGGRSPQEIAAKAAGVELGFPRNGSPRWSRISRAEAGSCRTNNQEVRRCCPRRGGPRHPIGTACGFAVTIGKARFVFTPAAARAAAHARGAGRPADPLKRACRPRCM